MPIFSFQFLIKVDFIGKDLSPVLVNYFLSVSADKMKSVVVWLVNDNKLGGMGG